MSATRSVDVGLHVREPISRAEAASLLRGELAAAGAPADVVIEDPSRLHIEELWRDNRWSTSAAWYDAAGTHHRVVVFCTLTDPVQPQDMLAVSPMGGGSS